MKNYVDLLKNFLPQAATILELPKPQARPAVLLADIDGDHIEELIGAYKYEEQNYILILKLINDQWLPLIHIKGNGYGLTDLKAAPITDNWANTLIMGWQIGDVWSELDLMQWTNSEFVRLPTNNIVYSKLEVEDMPGQYGPDGQYELAVWIHDTSEAYRVDVYRFSEGKLVPARDVYPYYFKKVEAYYERLLQTEDLSCYRHYLSDAQKKVGDLELLKDASFNDQVVINTKKGNVTGDNIIDTVYLSGDKTEGSEFWKNITLNILNGDTNICERISIKENAGYNPTIFLGDFTGNHVDDILIVIDTGGSGGTIYAYVFSDFDGKMEQVFSVDEYNERSKYEVNYQKQNKVTVNSSNPKKEYILDLMYKGKEYLSEIYNDDGTLREPIAGWVDPVSGLYPIDLARDGTYELTTLQEIAGRYHADALGYVQNVLRWNGDEFVSDRQSVSIFGEDVTSP